jgi:hypothetical protein
MTDSPQTHQSSDQDPADQASATWLEQQVQHLLVAAEHELRARGPLGLSELDLIRALQSERWQLIGPVNFMEPDQLYPVHFLLFHTLYRLRDQLAEDNETLIISPLRLSILPQPEHAGQTLPDEEDKLRQFYLDLSQYFMSNGDIQGMMDNFWAGVPSVRPDSDAAARAAETLGFDDLPDTFTTVKQGFRRQVMQAHPDRGGSTEAVQELNEAFSVLKAHYA